MSELFTGTAGSAGRFSDDAGRRKGGRNARARPRAFGEVRPIRLQAA